jgi:hypothetical protein
MTQVLTKEEKERILRTLEEDKEFRYAIAGLIGMREILERLDKIEEEQKKIWEEVKLLREGQQKLWEEVKSLREGQQELWKGQQKLWEGQQELWKEVRGLRKNFEQLGKAVGMTLEYYTAAFLEEYLSERGYEGARVEVGVKLKYMGKTVELDLFCEDPLLVGEVTTGVVSLEEARREINKLLERVNFVKEMYERDVDIKILAIANVGAEAVEFLREIAEKHGIMVIIGREIKEIIS